MVAVVAGEISPLIEIGVDLAVPSDELGEESFLFTVDMTTGGNSATFSVLTSAATVLAFEGDFALLFVEAGSLLTIG